MMLELEGRPEHELSNVEVRTEDQNYRCNSVELYANWVKLFTDREQYHTDYEVVLAASKVLEIVEQEQW